MISNKVNLLQLPDEILADILWRVKTSQDQIHLKNTCKRLKSVFDECSRRKLRINLNRFYKTKDQRVEVNAVLETLIAATSIFVQMGRLKSMYEHKLARFLERNCGTIDINNIAEFLIDFYKFVERNLNSNQIHIGFALTLIRLIRNFRNVSTNEQHFRKNSIQLSYKLPNVWFAVIWTRRVLTWLHYAEDRWPVLTGFTILLLCQRLNKGYFRPLVCESTCIVFGFESSAIGQNACIVFNLTLTGSEKLMKIFQKYVRGTDKTLKKPLTSSDFSKSNSFDFLVNISCKESSNWGAHRFQELFVE